MLEKEFKDFMPELKETFVMFCGPVGFCDGAKAAFKQLGFENK